MPHIVGIVGYQNSGKTTLVRALARELTARGRRVAVVKHTHHPIDLPGKDTALLGEVVEQTVIISPQESALFWKRPVELEEIIPHLQADVILIEGFKQAQSHPKIACLRGAPDDAALLDEWVICAVGPATYTAEADILRLDRDDISQIADLVERHQAAGEEI